MPTRRDLARLNRHALLLKLASLGVLLFGLIGFILYFRPSLAGVASESLGDYQTQTVWGRDPSCGGNWFLRYPCLKNFFHNWLITNDLKSTKA
jgi:hypothetical protein